MCKAVEEYALENFAEGKEEGREEGRTESMEATATKMLRDGFSLENAAEYSGLSLERVKELSKLLNSK